MRKLVSRVLLPFRLLAYVGFITVIFACDAALVGRGGTEAGGVDATVVDATVVDATVVDATVVDATVVDATVMDAAVVDAAIVDATVVDAYADGDSAIAGTIYYVANGGDDNADGLTPATAWATASKVTRSLFSPGDAVLFKRGDTWNEQLVVPTSGSAAGGYITFGAYGTGDKPVFDGTGLTLNKYHGLIQLMNRSHIIIEGLKVQHVGFQTLGTDPGNPSTGTEVGNENHGINIGVNSSQVIARYNDVSMTEAAGIRAHISNNVTIYSNTVTMACIRSESESISISSCHHVEVMYNIVHSNANLIGGGGSGIDLKGGTYDGKVHHNNIYNITTNGIYADAWDKYTSNIRIYSNYIHDSEGFGITIGSEAGGQLDNVLVHHNVIARVRKAGLMFHDKFTSSGVITNIKVFNNTFYDVGSTVNDWNGAVRMYDTLIKSVYIQNNIFSQSKNYHVGKQTSSALPDAPISAGGVYTVATNVYDRASDNNSVGGNTAVPSDPVIDAPPSFADATNSDFHLNADSPAKGACDKDVWHGIPNVFDGDGTGLTDASGNILVGTVSCGAYQ